MAILGRRFAFTVLITIVLTVMVASPEVHAFSDPLQQAVEREISALFQGPVRIGAVEISNLSKIAITDVVVYDPLLPKERMLEIKEISVKYSLLSLLFNMDNLAKALREITFIEPKWTISKDERGIWNLDRMLLLQSGSHSSTDFKMDIGVEGGKIVVENFDQYLPELSVGVEGRLSVDGLDMNLSRLAVNLFGVTLTAKGEFDTNSIDVMMAAEDFNLQQLMDNFPQFSDLLLSCIGSVEVYAKGELTDPQVTGTVSAAKGRIGLPSVSDVTYEFDRAFASFSYGSGVVGLDDFVLEAGSSIVTGSGSMAAFGDVNLDVVGKNIDFSRYLPIFADARISGPADVKGKVTGAFSNPLLKASISKQGGTFFGVPVEETQGNISLDLYKFAFNDVRVQKNNSLLEMNGYMGYGQGSVVDARVVATEVEASDILHGLDISPVAKGSVTGRLSFRGPFAALVTEGDIRVKNGFYGAQQFDTGSARFKVGRGYSEIMEASVRLDGGQVRFAGRTLTPGTLLLSMDAEAVPLQKIEFFEGINTGMDGIVSFRGNALVSGTVGMPRAKLELDLSEGRRLALGPTVKLDFSYTDSHLQ